mmetsp:Transcript_12784/g.32703  ORF Transcript_12784/g.32703 Transcript_12784/m.32703 type:complete len:242 (+) Transcript_12784:71-796(+)
MSATAPPPPPSLSSEPYVAVQIGVLDQAIVESATDETNRKAQLTPTAARIRLQKLRPSVSEAIDLARARGRMASGTGVPSRMPGESALYVGSGAHAGDLATLERFGIKGVLNLAPSVCKDPVAAYQARGIAYLELDARDDRSFPLLGTFLEPASSFINGVHADGGGVLCHCMAGVNRSATIAVAHLMIRDRRELLALFAECSASRPSILQNPSFQLQLCVLAHRHGLLTSGSASEESDTAL